jgi:ribosomal protein S18 acetylase RimI-like enzyme
MISYRQMTEGDIPEGLSLCRAAGWNQTAADWELFLRLSPKGCRVGVDENGDVKGTVTTVRYQDHFSWIGMVLVDPDYRRQGIGIQLLREALQILEREETIKLDATPNGREVYRQLDFVDEYRISRMQLKSSASMALPLSSAVPLTQRHIAAVLAFDRDVFGADRKAVLDSLLNRGPQYCFFREGNNGIGGYCFGRNGHQFAHIGPVISTDLDTARALVVAALDAAKGASVVLDALHHTPQWIEWLMSIGFEEQRPLMRMYRGTNAYPGTPEKQFAILGPEFG